MVQVFPRNHGKRLGLPGRSSVEVVSGDAGAEQMTFRIVEIAPTVAGAPPRGPHVHRGFEECIYVQSGQGFTETASARHPVAPGDTVVVPAGELHVTHNTGDTPLVLLCFFPVPGIAAATREFPSWDAAGAQP